MNFREEVHNLERELIRKALVDNGGSVTNAAKALGFDHHQSLSSIINNRHYELLEVRTPIHKRRKHLMDHERTL
jgi:transcriptional regulator with GAF, ATPase, and Fis domain